MVKNDDLYVETLENRKVTTASVFTLEFTQNTIRISALAGWIKVMSVAQAVPLDHFTSDPIMSSSIRCALGFWIMKPEYIMRPSRSMRKLDGSPLTL